MILKRPWPGDGRLLQHARVFQDGFHRPGRLPETAHAAHALEQGRGEPGVAEQVVMQEVQVPPGEPADLRESVINGLGVELLVRPSTTAPVHAIARATPPSNVMNF
jgi:hypothetical protein